MENEDALLGQYVKLLNADRRANQEAQALIAYDGPLAKSIKEAEMPAASWEESARDPERGMKRLMSVNPDAIISLAETLRAKQKEFAREHKELRDFEAKYPEIVKLHKS